MGILRRKDLEECSVCGGDGGLNVGRKLFGQDVGAAGGTLARGEGEGAMVEHSLGVVVSLSGGRDPKVAEHSI